MAARLTDKQKKKIVADYLELRSVNAAAKKNHVSWKKAREAIDEDEELTKKLEQKKEQNTADIIAYMESQKDDVCEVLRNGMKALKEPNAFDKSSPREIATTMAILIDKYSGMKKDIESEDSVKVIVDV